MIGDHQGINRALAYQKALAGFYMVYLHGMTLFGLSIPWMNFSHILPMARVLSALKCVLAGGLPIFAGFYFRNQVGPFLKNHRLPANFAFIGFRFFLLGCVLEGLRLTLTTLHVVYFLNWEALHFIGLSMIITSLLLALDERLVPLFAIALVATHSWLSPFFLKFTIQANEVSNGLANSISWLWCFTFALLLGWFFRQIQKRFFSEASYPVALWLAAACAPAFAIALACRFLVVASPRTIASFINLPISAVYTNNFDDNYWGLATAYPIFIFGYFMRAILFNPKYQKFFLATVALALLGVAQYFIFEFDDLWKLMGTKTTWTKSNFMTNAGLFGELSIFYLIFVAIYYTLAGRQIALLNRWARASRSILVLYLVHGLILVLVLKVFPFDFVAQYKSQPIDKTLRVVELFVLVAYILSLLSTSAITDALDAFLKQDSAI